jgi:hypothetical protein
VALTLVAVIPAFTVATGHLSSLWFKEVMRPFTCSRSVVNGGPPGSPRAYVTRSPRGGQLHRYVLTHASKESPCQGMRA